MIFQTIPNADNGQTVQTIVTPEPGDPRPELTEAERNAGRETEGLAKAKEQESIRSAIAAKRVEQIQGEMDAWDTMTAPDDAPAEPRRAERSDDGRPVKPVSRRTVRGEPEPARPVMHHLDLGGGAVIPVNDEQIMQLARQGAVRVIAEQQRPPQHYQPPQHQQPAYRQVPAQPIVDEGRAREIAKRISYGSEDEAGRALVELASEIAGKARGPAIDPQTIAQQATQHMVAQAQFQQNLHTIGREFPDVFNDRSLSQLAALKLHEVRARDAAIGVARPELDAYREACGMVRNAIGSRGPAPAVGAPRRGPAPQRRYASSAPDMRTLDVAPSRSAFLEDDRRNAVLAMKRARGQAF